jgi:polysaccharide deacetylase family protein (PEP-CTERM system associated)
MSGADDSRREGAHRVLNAMTVDVEDYFHVSNFERVVTPESWPTRESRVERNTDRLLQTFADVGVTATFFVLGWVGERFPQLVRRIAAAGHEVASHGYAHRLIFDQSPAEFRDDVRRAKALLEDGCGSRVDGYRAPSFSVTERSLWALDVLIDEGYRYDSSVYPIHHDRYGIPSAPRHPHVMRRERGSLLEVPGSTVQIGRLNLPIGGGGYFRILPYGWTRWGIARVNRIEQRPTVFYLHPWEIDPDQPRLPASALARFRHYRHLDRTETRLRRLLSDFRFGSIRQLIAGLPSTEQWSGQPALAHSR